MSQDDDPPECQVIEFPSERVVRMPPKISEEEACDLAHKIVGLSLLLLDLLKRGGGA